MSDEHQPEAVWVFPEKKSNKGRIWLIVALSVLALAIVLVVLYFFLPRTPAPQPTATPSATASPSPSSSATATPTPTPTPTPTATSEPVPSQAPTEEPKPVPPPAPDPDVSSFAGQVRPWLDDAATGLGYVADSNGQEAAQIIDTLQQDAQRLSDAGPPRSIASDWYPALGDYSAKLGELRSAADNGVVSQSALNGTKNALKALRSLVGI